MRAYATWTEVDRGRRGLSPLAFRRESVWSARVIVALAVIVALVGCNVVLFTGWGR